MKELTIAIVGTFALIFLGYLFLGFTDWIAGDPLNIINNYK